MKHHTILIVASLLLISCTKSPVLFEDIRLGQDFEEFSEKIKSSKNITEIDDPYVYKKYKYDMGGQYYRFWVTTIDNKIDHIYGGVFSNNEYESGMKFKNKIISVLVDKYGTPDTFSWNHTPLKSDGTEGTKTFQSKVYKWEKKNYRIEFSYYEADKDKPFAELTYGLSNDALNTLRKNQSKSDKKNIDL